MHGAVRNSVYIVESLSRTPLDTKNVAWRVNEELPEGLSVVGLGNRYVPRGSWSGNEASLAY